VNYRRLLDDRHWPHTRRLEEIADYFPTPFLVLRTLKGEIMVGLSPGQAETLTAKDPTWLINGKRGIIQLVTGTTLRAGATFAIASGDSSTPFSRCAPFGRSE